LEWNLAIRQSRQSGEWDGGFSLLLVLSLALALALALELALELELELELELSGAAEMKACCSNDQIKNRTSLSFSLSLP